MLLYAVWAPAAFAGNGDVCMVDRYNTVHGTSVDSLNCAAKDVKLAVYEIAEGQSSCVAGQTISVKLKGVLESTAGERFDFGVFIAEGNNDPNTVGGACYTDFLHPVSPDNIDINLTGGAGPYYNGELGVDTTDFCGDIQSGAPVSFITGLISIKCQDSDGDNVADVDTCTVWANSASDGTDNKPSCEDEADVIAESSPKCTCSSVNIVGLDYDELGKIEVIKELVPADDEGLFNLLIDDKEVVSDVGHDGTTDLYFVDAGTTLDPGRFHTVHETAGAGTSLDSYTSSISCVDRGLHTFDGEDPLTDDGAGPIDVLVKPGDDIVCTITNEHVCANSVCASSACATSACDPTGAPGNCAIKNPFVKGTECRASGGACDPAEVCDGSSALCPDDALLPAKTECRGSAGVCDPAEVCDGSSALCPDDALLPAKTECRGSAGVCDPAEVCVGSSALCPDDALLPAKTECRGSAGVCDPAEVCDGSSVACPSDSKDSKTVCRISAGVCDAAEVCDGIDNDCPDDVLARAGTVCEPSGTGDVICDPPEICDGLNADCPGPPEANIAEEGTYCGNQSTTACTDPDTCDDAGFCENNNKVCGSVTNSALCEFDMEPTKGTCYGPPLVDGKACVISDACQLGGGACDYDVLAADYLCTGGSEHGQDCEVPTEDACASGGGTCFDGQCAGGRYDGTACCIDGGGVCRQSDQFRLLFSPDVQNWVGYRLDASNPGQTFYNVIYDANEAEGDVTLTVTVPYPYITVGGMPLHVYDDVALDEANCYVPGEAILSEPMFITLDDWINGADGSGDYNLRCDTVVDPGGSGFCSFDVFIPNEAIPEDGLLYVNVHLDYALKGRSIDANPVGMWAGTGTLEDRYDRAAYVSPWSSSDALVNTSTNNGPLGIADCSAYWFEHTDDVNAGICAGGGDGGQPCVEDDDCADPGVCTPVPLFDDSVENLNLFKQISGVFGRVSCAGNGGGFAYYLSLVNAKGEVVAKTRAEDEGYYIFEYRHKGKPATYTVKVYKDAARTMRVDSADVILQGNGWWEVSFTATDCGDADEAWTASVTYGSGRYRK